MKASEKKSYQGILIFLINNFIINQRGIICEQVIVKFENKLKYKLTKKGIEIIERIRQY